MSKGIIVGADTRNRRNLITFFQKQDLPCVACETLADLPAQLATDPGMRFTLLLADLRISDDEVRKLAPRYVIHRVCFTRGKMEFAKESTPLPKNDAMFVIRTMG